MTPSSSAGIFNPFAVPFSIQDKGDHWSIRGILNTNRVDVLKDLLPGQDSYAGWKSEQHDFTMPTAPVLFGVYDLLARHNESPHYKESIDDFFSAQKKMGSIGVFLDTEVSYNSARDLVRHGKNHYEAQVKKGNSKNPDKEFLHAILGLESLDALRASLEFQGLGVDQYLAPPTHAGKMCPVSISMYSNSLTIRATDSPSIVRGSLGVRVITKEEQ